MYCRRARELFSYSSPYAEWKRSHYCIAHKVWVHSNFTILFIYVIFHPHWIGRRGHLEWSPRSPDLSFLDFFFWGMLKEKVYSMKIANLNHFKERVISQCAEIDGNVQ